MSMHVFEKTNRKEYLYNDHRQRADIRPILRLAHIGLIIVEKLRAQ